MCAFSTFIAQFLFTLTLLIILVAINVRHNVSYRNGQYHVCTGWNGKKQWMLALLTLVKWVEHVCRSFTGCVVVGWCRYGVGDAWRPAKLSNCGLCEEWWLCRTWRVVEDLWPRSGVVVLVWVDSRREALCKVPYFPFVMWCRSHSTCSYSKSVHNQRQLLGSIVKDQPPYFHKFLLFMEVSPVFSLGTSQFWMASRSMPVKLFVLNFFRVVMTHFSRQHILKKKVLRCSQYDNVSSVLGVTPKLNDKWYQMFMTLMFITLQQWACPPNIKYRHTELFSTLCNNIGYDKFYQCLIVGYISLSSNYRITK